MGRWLVGYALIFGGTLVALAGRWRRAAAHLGWIGQVQCFEGGTHDARNGGVAIPFTVHRDDKPGRPLRAAALQRDLISRYVVTPMLSLGEVVGLNFHRFDGRFRQYRPLSQLQFPAGQTVWLRDRVGRCLQALPSSPPEPDGAPGPRD